MSRAEAPRSSRPVYVYRPSPWYYDPWGYGYGYGAYGYGHGGFGIGYSYYSPWAWRAAGPGSWGLGYGPGYGPGWYGARGYDTGRVRLRVSPRDAEVFVDGYYAGIVDDFDGTFQGLRLDPGGYRIEVRKPGFEPLTFDVRVQFDRTITFRGELKTQP
ncbi:MAG: PEGA domain-containing protein [Acidobacteria bacterium]|nr:PEGA domain-containing protein [Acidobacteriota bacterium]